MLDIKLITIAIIFYILITIKIFVLQKEICDIKKNKLNENFT